MLINMYALIMAGGLGSRLWPRSRSDLPKQFLDLLSDETMLQMARRRIDKLVSPGNTIIATNYSSMQVVKRQLPDIPDVNILGEPVGRNTAAAIGLAATHIFWRDPDSVMVVLTADHLIKDVDRFLSILDFAAESSLDNWLVTLGIQPDYPETGYGYIEQGSLLRSGEDTSLYEVNRFVEKPNQELAKEYVADGKFYWNSGMFIWKTSAILDEISRSLPDLYEGLKVIESSIGSPAYQEVLETVFPTLPAVSIDYGIMERAKKVAMVPASIGWNDVGSWSAVYDVLPKNEDHNVIIGSHLGIDTTSSYIYSPNKLVATIGLRDMVIIDTDDVVLICPRSESQTVKKLVDALEEKDLASFISGASSEMEKEDGLTYQLWLAANLEERLLLSLIIHAGLTPEQIISAGYDGFDVLNGWMSLPYKRKLPDITRNTLFDWMRQRDRLKFEFKDVWGSTDEILSCIEVLGEKIGIHVCIADLLRDD